MRINENLVLTGERVVLVPYRPEHVARYHVWMQSEELLELTCSEPMSLEEVAAMQQRWLHDDDKCTFIVLERGEGGGSSHGGVMVGDVNLILMSSEPECAEIDVMIAEPSARRKGLAREAVQLLMRYALDEDAFHVKTFVAKIVDSNEPSLRLFGQLGFEVASHSEVFEQTTLRWELAQDTRSALEAATKGVTRSRYDS